MGTALRTVLLLAAVLGLARAAAAQQPSYFEDIGYNALVARLGSASVPTGAGITVAQVEALENRRTVSTDPYNYLPNATAFPGKTIVDVSGGGSVSGHATTVGQVFYGDQSIAPGITNVDAYRAVGDGSAGDWIGPAYLNTGTNQAPLTNAARVQNFSFVDAGDDPNAAGVLDIQQRLDYAIRRDNFVAVVAVNNGAGAIPALLANGYNTIAVGLTNGNSSVGPTTGDTTGRSKPDIVAPMGETSFATPVVSAAAALLLNVADAKTDPGEAARAGRTETIKAALLSGATTAEFSGLASPWHRDTVTVNGTTFDRPLDARFGAGEVNIDNSHKILSAAEGVGTTLTVNGRYGWDYQTVTASDAVRRYYLDVPAGTDGATLTATATWLRDIPQSGPNAGNPTLSELFLRVYQSDANFTTGTLLDQSVSPVDNVQHTRTTGLQAGQRYVIEVSLASLPAGQLSENFAVAWALEPVPEPGWVLAFAAAGVGISRVRRRSLPPAVL